MCRATQDGCVMVESSDKMWPTGEGSGKPLQYYCPKSPMNSRKRQKDMISDDEPPRSVGVQDATGEEQRNSSRKNEVAGPKWKKIVMDVPSGESKLMLQRTTLHGNLEC